MARRTEPRPEGLTVFEERFCQEYTVDYRAGHAAKRAGSNSKRPRQIGYELLKRPDIRARVDDLIAEQKERTRITADRTLLELAELGYIDAKTLATWPGAKLSDKISALDKLAKHHKLYSDAPNINVNVTYEQALAELDDEGMFGENGDADG